jgi:hypothetical protein
VQEECQAEMILGHVDSFGKSKFSFVSSFRNNFERIEIWTHDLLLRPYMNLLGDVVCPNFSVNDFDPVANVASDCLVEM